MQSLQRNQDFYEHPVYTYITQCITCYVGHNPSRYNICYTAGYTTFFMWLYNILYRRKKPVCGNICYIKGYVTKFDYHSILQVI